MKNTATGPTYETATAGQANNRDLMRLPDHIRAQEPMTPEQAKERYYRLQQIEQINRKVDEQLEECTRLLAEIEQR